MNILNYTGLPLNILLAGCFFLHSCMPGQREINKPNVILILTDDQGYGDMGVAGHPCMMTPNIDRLAQEGTLFKQFYVNATVCAPTRVALMTGHFPARHNVHTIYYTADHNRQYGVPDFLDPDVLTVADIMKEAGYITGHIGKWHLSGRVPDYPEPGEYGFDFDMITHGAGQHPVYRERFAATEHHVNLSSHWIMEDGIGFIEKNRDSGKPFYLNLWTLVPHAPLKPTSEELAVYENLQARPQDFESWMQDYAGSAQDMNSQMKVYCASMTSLDAAIGKLLDYLDETGLAENTLIVFTSDNGPEDYHVGNATNAGLGSPGVFRGRKRSIYEGGIRMPCIIKWPGHVHTGKVSNAVWSGVDWLPTLAGMAGIDLPASYQPDGEDVSDVFRGSEREHNKSLFWEWKLEVAGNQEYLPPQLAVRKGSWKLLCDADGGRPELYDLTTDPEERNNLVNEKAEVAEDLKTVLLDWKKTIPETAYTVDGISE